MIFLAAAILLTAVFYTIGRLVHRGQDLPGRLSFIKPVAALAEMAVVAALILSAVATCVVLCVTAVTAAIDGIDEDSLLALLSGGALLLVIFTVIFTAAILQFLLREWLSRRNLVLRLTDDEYTITEYLIQWSTIFLAVYQFLFQGLSEALREFIHPDSTRELVYAVFNPNNINLTIQPVLMCCWVALVMEKLRREKYPDAYEKKKKPVEGKNCPHRNRK